MIAVVGGGPAGCAAAVTARAAGHEVELWHTGPAPGARPTESLPPGGEDLVHEIFGSFRAEAHLPSYGNRSSWGNDAVEETAFVFNPLGNGWHLDRPAFDADLRAAAGREGVTIVEQRARRPRAAFVVDASGRSARIARDRGARRIRSDRLVACFRPEPGPDELVVAAREDGWSYTAPGIDAYLTDWDLLGDRQGTVTDASTSWLDRIAGPGWVATGDAAAAFDPLSSQGIVTALLMGRAAGRVAAGELDPAEYEREYASVVLEHLALRDAYYAVEERWPEATFWKRRGATSRRASRFASS